MQIVDEIYRDFKDLGYFDDLKNISSIDNRYKKIAEIVSKVNVFKAEMQDLTSDEQLYLFYKLQQIGVELGLCQEFYIFYSNKNAKFHHVCKKDDSRAFCRGEKNRCSKNN